MTAKEQALKQIAQVAREHDLTPAEILEELASPAGASDSGTSVVTSLFGYLGAIFLLVGLGVFIEMQWKAMGSAARIAVTLGSGIAVFVAAVLADRSEQRRNTAVPLFLLAAVLQPMGILVTIAEFSKGGDDRHAILLTSGILLIQQCVTFLKTGRTTLLLTTLIFGVCAYGVSLDLLDLDGDLIVCTLGLSVLFVTYWIDSSPHAAITPFWYFVGATAMLGGLFSLLKDSSVEILMLAASCAVVVLSIWVKSRLLLLVGAVAILSYVIYYTAEHFADVIGWPIALILLGLLLIGLSAVAFRINRKYIAEN